MDRGFVEESRGDMCKTVDVAELFGYREEITDLLHPLEPANHSPADGPR